MGIQSIMEAREIILLVSGEQKADALAEVINGDVTEAFPASILQKHNNVTIIADEAALAKASHESHPLFKRADDLFRKYFSTCYILSHFWLRRQEFQYKPMCHP